MDNSITNKQIEEFYEDVKMLDLKFPVAVISKATGYNKSNVSSYLKGKLPPSVGFLRKFYEVFPKSNKKVPIEGQETAQVSTLAENDGHYLARKEGQNLTEKTLLELVISNRVMAEANKDLASAHKTIANNNEELIKLVGSIGGAESKRSLAEVERIAGFLEIVAKIGVKAGMWSNEMKAREVLNKYVPLPDMRTEESGSRVGVGKHGNG